MKNNPSQKPAKELNPIPISEVVYSVIFDDQNQLNDTHTAKIHDLFKNDFPIYEEHPVASVEYEIFVRNAPPIASRTQEIIQRGTRCWFISEDKHLLIQYQRNAFSFNWRKLNQTELQYPGFTKLSEDFKRFLDRFKTFYEAEFNSTLSTTQAGLKYLNSFPPSDQSNIQKHFNFTSGIGENIESQLYIFTKRISDDAGKPIGRLRGQITAADELAGNQPTYLELKFNGMPKENITSFLLKAHSQILTAFKNLIKKL